MRNLLKLEIDPNRVYGLDILRAAAILFVVLEHSGHLLPEFARRSINYFVFDGVSIFFVLSGFLIGGILINILQNSADSKSLWNFWIRRWFRTLPNYFLVLSLVCIIQLASDSSFNFTAVLGYFTFTQNLASPHPSFFPEAWSLSVEEWFYVIVPAVIVVLIRVLQLPSRIAVASAVVSILVLVTCFRYYRFEQTGITSLAEWDLTYRKQVITRLDSLMYGVVGAYIQYYHQSRWQRHKVLLLISGIAILLASKYWLPNVVSDGGRYSAVFSFSTISFGTLLLLPFLVSVKIGQGLVHKLITYVSLTSYSIYLLNFTLVEYTIIKNLPWTTIFESTYLFVALRYCLYWILVFVLSILLYKYWELPITRLRDSVKVRKPIPVGRQ